MPKKTLMCLSIALLTLVVWVYYNASLEHNTASLVPVNNNINTNYYIFNTILQPKNIICSESTLFIILVTSYIGHVELRSAHRQTISADDLQNFNITRVFLLGRIPQNEKYISQEAVMDESNTFDDILQGDFYENYRNLTHKHLMGLNWAATHCSKTPFILKVDDDTVFNIDTSYKYISQLPRTDNQLLIGYILNNTKPRRSKQNKWYVTYEEYSRQTYPPYLSGWYYIMHTSLAARICAEAKHQNYFWIDDILVTGIITESLKVKLKQLPENYWLEYYELLECCLKDMITKFIKCDYTVGPNGGRNNLINEFNKAYKLCDKWQNCTTRPADLNLKKVCILNRDRAIFSDGKAAEINGVKL
ncbi:beta-1,3-galactosyltransferase 2-like [Aricia agestis]|uniref:beta-1,3-galactosyltransferase 2-like n=1 Tax=Aricia agestis TaxID=91739 RepID=UPI001C20444A|nr:beta-1,3-galactosyltransferase 2-like [Aricia agestis]